MKTFADTLTILVLILSIVVFCYAVWNLINAMRQNRTTRYTLLRNKVYMNQLRRSIDELNKSLEPVADPVEEPEVRVHYTINDYVSSAANVHIQGDVAEGKDAYFTDLPVKLFRRADGEWYTTKENADD